MKLIRTKREKLVFEISLPEKRLLCEVLKLYPLISATHHRLSKTARSAKHDENQWLLQVLNDVRVGSWIALGSPDPEQGKKIVFNEKILPHFRAMELAGAFETVFLDALSGRTPVE